MFRASIFHLAIGAQEGPKYEIGAFNDWRRYAGFIKDFSLSNF
jgi:hypothetical protein